MHALLFVHSVLCFCKYLNNLRNRFSILSSYYKTN